MNLQASSYIPDSLGQVIAWYKAGFSDVIAEDGHTFSKYYFAAFWDSLDVAVQ